ncbi:MAG: type I methionyl aminopeptidase, partial [Candidatus Sungiibacteriota bacterium]
MAEEIIMIVSRKTPEEIETLRQGGARLAVILRDLAAAARPGISTSDLDTMAEQMIREAGGDAVFKGYRIAEVKAPFPASICVSINDEVVHGIPRADRFLAEGDIFSIDIGMRWPADKGMVTDMAITVGIGKISADAERLIRATRESLDEAIIAIRPGASIGDIGFVVATRLKKDNLGVIRDLAGHGVGYELHEPPMIPNFGKQGAGIKLQEGMVIAIEPMATLGGWRIALDDDEWTFRTADHSLAAHFEHTIAVTRTGAEVLTSG